MELATRRSIEGGVLFTAGAVLGREFIFWGLGRVLDAGASLVRSAAKGVTMPGAVPWLDVLGLFLMVVGGWLLMSNILRKGRIAAPLDWGSIKKSIYVANITADLEKLRNEHVVRFHVTIFNGSNALLVVDKLAGKILLGSEFNEKDMEAAGLTPPFLFTAQSSLLPHQDLRYAFSNRLLSQRLKRSSASLTAMVRLRSSLRKWNYLQEIRTNNGKYGAQALGWN